MVDKLINDLDSGTIATNTEIEMQLDGAVASTKALISALLSLYDADTATLTNKTFDANATGNSISNIEDADIVDDTLTLTKIVPGTKGEVIATDGTTRQLLVVGTNDQVLTAASGETTGLKWAAAGGGSSKTFAKVVKTSDETVNSSVTLQDDDVLKFTPTINKTYSVMIMLWVNSTAVADFKYALSIPTGATSNRLNGVYDSRTAIGQEDWTSADTWNFGGADGGQIVYGKLIMGTTAGDLTVQWAQNFLEVSDTKVLKGSMILAWEEG